MFHDLSVKQEWQEDLVFDHFFFNVSKESSHLFIEIKTTSDMQHCTIYDFVDMTLLNSTFL